MPVPAVPRASSAKRRALVVVDVQPTFCEGGELPVAGGNAVAARVADFLQAHHGDYALVVTTQDWHVDPGAHFSDVPDFVDTWPPHGLAGSPNAELHPALAPALEALPHVVRIRKGARVAAYSGFDGTDDAGQPLADVLRAAGISDVDVCGIAESHCVKCTAIDAAELGLAVTVLSDLTVPVTEQLGVEARAQMRAAGVRSRSALERQVRPRAPGSEV